MLSRLTRFEKTADGGNEKRELVCVASFNFKKSEKLAMP